MSIARRVKECLEENHVPYVHCTHRLAYTAQEVAAAQHVPGREVAKTVVVKIDGKPALVVLPATMKLSVEEFREELGQSNVSLASEREFADLFPDSEIGAMAPFGNLYMLPVYVDKALSEDREIVFNAGTHVDTIRMQYADFERLVRPRIVKAAIRAETASGQ